MFVGLGSSGSLGWAATDYHTQLQNHILNVSFVSEARTVTMFILLKVGNYKVQRQNGFWRHDIHA
jgi:hypothetical protein